MFTFLCVQNHSLTHAKLTTPTRPYSVDHDDASLQTLDDTHDAKAHDRKKRDTAAAQTKTDSETDTAPTSLVTQIDPTATVSLAEHDTSATKTKRSNADEASLAPENSPESLAGSSEGQRTSRQLRQLGNWQYRSLDTSLSRQNGYSPSSFDPFGYTVLPTATTYFKPGARYFQPQTYSKKELTYNDYLEAYGKSKQPTYNVRPAELQPHKTSGLQNYKTVAKITPQDTIIPLLLANQQQQSHRSHQPNYGQAQFTAAAFVNSHNAKKYTTPASPLDGDEETIPDNFAFFHFGNTYSSTPISVNNHAKAAKQSKPSSVQISNVAQPTQKTPYIAFSSVGGFFNNQPTANPLKESFVLKPNHSSKPKQTHPGSSGGPSTPAPVYEGISNAIQSNGLRFAVTTPKIVAGTGLELYQPNVYLNAPRPQVYSGYSAKPAGAIYEASTPKPSAQFVTKSTNGFQPIAVSTTPKYYQPQVSKTVSPSEYSKFYESIKNTHIAQVKPNAEPSPPVRIGASQLAVYRPTVSNNTKLQPVSQGYGPQQVFYSPVRSSSLSPVSKPQDSGEFYYEEDDEIDQRGQKYVKNTLDVVRRPVYGKRPYGDEEEDEDEYYEDDEDDDEYQYRYPVNKSKYTPMTETMAPRPMLNLTTPKPPGAVSGNLYYNYETTTWRPVTVTTYSQGSTSDIPPIIKFPEDVFQGIKPLGDVPRYLNKSTLRPYTIRQRLRPTVVQHNHLEENVPSERVRISTTTTTTTTTTTRPPPTTTTTTPRYYPTTVRTRIPTKTIPTRRPVTTTTTSKPPPPPTTTTQTTSRKRYTIRPNRGQQRWRTTETPEPSTGLNGRQASPTRPTKHRPQLELDERLPNRYSLITGVSVSPFYIVKAKRGTA